MINETAARRVVTINCIDSSGATIINVLESNATIYTKPFYVGDGIVNAFDFGIALLPSTATVAIGSAKMSLVFEQGSLNLSTASADTIANSSWNTISVLVSNSTTTGSWTSGPVSIQALPYGRFKVIATTPTTACTISLNYHKQI